MAVSRVFTSLEKKIARHRTSPGWVISPEPRRKKPDDTLAQLSRVQKPFLLFLFPLSTLPVAHILRRRLNVRLLNENLDLLCLPTVPETVT